MEPEMEASPFESSEALASFLLSTPLLVNSLKMCSVANMTKPGSFAIEQCGDVGYVAFSGVQMIDGSEPSCGTMVELRGSGGYCTEQGLFSALKCDGGAEEKTVMVDAGFLRLFLSFYSSPDFLQQMRELLGKCKSIIVTGHSLGATTASLTALWLLSDQQFVSSSPSILCITFGSPMLGNEALNRAILQERWGGKFCHIVSKHDIMPRLFFAPLAPSLIRQFQMLLHFWQSALTSPCSEQLISEMRKQDSSEFFSFVLDHTLLAAQSAEGTESRKFWPSGSYLFCSEEGAICLDGATSVIKMMHLMLMTGSPVSCVEDHLKYADHVGLLSSQFLKKSVNVDVLSESSYEAGVSFALRSSGISPQDDVFGPARDCLEMARRIGRAPNLNNAHLAVRLSKVTPCRAQLEWYKTRCDESEDQIGYYDTFKKMGARKREYTVNMNLFQLGIFWDEVLRMVEGNEVSHDFHRRSKWVNASQFYMILAEPLEIARYYRNNTHLQKGHYIENGRERRFQVFDKWWKQRRSGEKRNDSRTKYASLTQDPCFWARVEEAKDWLESAPNEGDSGRLALLLKRLNDFEAYAAELIWRKEVSKDVVAEKSSYSMWVKNWRVLKLQFPQLLPSTPGY